MMIQTLVPTCHHYDSSSGNTPAPDSVNFSNNSSSSDSDDDLTLLSVKRLVHSVRVGSKIMKKFHGKLFVDTITELSRSGERYYRVDYDDGDSETMTDSVRST